MLGQVLRHETPAKKIDSEGTGINKGEVAAKDQHSSKMKF